MKEVENENSIKIYEHYDSKKYFAVVMELCDCNLNDKLKESNGFTVDKIKKILIQLNNTFRLMIDKKIIHRDIKLENILVKDSQKENFIVKLSDYGEAKKLGTLSQMIESIHGTPNTQAPEILNGENYDSKSDLWSLGVIIYQLYFKKLPYIGNTATALYNIIKNDKNQIFIKKTGNTNLDDLIRKLLKFDPKERITWEEYFAHPFFK
jgi:serine/threonine-protein kinase ULK/ATG1